MCFEVVVDGAGPFCGVDCDADTCVLELWDVFTDEAEGGSVDVYSFDGLNGSVDFNDVVKDLVCELVVVFDAAHVANAEDFLGASFEDGEDAVEVEFEGIEV